MMGERQWYQALSSATPQQRAELKRANVPVVSGLLDENANVIWPYDDAAPDLSWKENLRSDALLNAAMRKMQAGSQGDLAVVDAAAYEPSPNNVAPSIPSVDPVGVQGLETVNPISLNPPSFQIAPAARPPFIKPIEPVRAQEFASPPAVDLEVPSFSMENENPRERLSMPPSFVGAESTDRDKAQRRALAMANARRRKAQGQVAAAQTNPGQSPERQGSGVLATAGNLGRGIGERAAQVAGGFVRAVGQTAREAGDYLEQRVPLGRIEFGSDGLSYRESRPEDFGAESPLIPLARKLEDADFGYTPGTTWEDVKRRPLSAMVPFALEQGIVSAPDMAAVMASLPGYVLARTGEIGQTRSENDLRQNATVEDFIKAAPASIGSALLERLGARGIFGLDDVAATTARDAVEQVARAGLKEGATEAGQEGIEYTGETAGTQKGFDPTQAFERMAAGFVGGTPFGAGVRAATATAEAVANRPAPTAQPEVIEPEPSPLALPAPRPQGEGFVMGSEPPGVRQELTRRQKLASTLAGKIEKEADPDKRAKLVDDLRTQNRAIQNLRDQLAPPPAAPVAVQENAAAAVPPTVAAPAAAPQPLQQPPQAGGAATTTNVDGGLAAITAAYQADTALPSNIQSAASRYQPVGFDGRPSEDRWSPYWSREIGGGLRAIMPSGTKALDTAWWSADNGRQVFDKMGGLFDIEPGRDERRMVTRRPAVLDANGRLVRRGAIEVYRYVPKSPDSKPLVAFEGAATADRPQAQTPAASEPSLIASQPTQASDTPAQTAAALMARDDVRAAVEDASVTVEQLQAERDAAAAAEREAQAEEAARRTDPEAFAMFRELQQRRETYRNLLDRSRADAATELDAGLASPEAAVADLDAEIQQLEARIGNATPRLAKKYRARLDGLRRERDARFADAAAARDAVMLEARQTDTPQAAQFRQTILDIDTQLQQVGQRMAAARRGAGASEVPTQSATVVEASRAAPAQVTTSADLDAAAQVVNTAPTEAQKEAGNYRKAHVRLNGLDIAIETPRGAVRSGTDRGGNAWEVVQPADYGYIKKADAADGDKLDVYIGRAPQSQTVYVIDQLDADTGRFDELKVMMGFPSQRQAMGAYRAAFSDGRADQRIGAVTPMTMEEFKAWLDKGKTHKPVQWKAPVEMVPSVVPAAPATAPARHVNSRATRRQGKAEDLASFLARNGGIRDDEGHSLRKQRNLQRMTQHGPMIRANGGMSIDDAGEALWQNGFFGPPETTARPAEAQVLDLLERLQTERRVYRAEEGQAIAASATDDQAADMNQAARDDIAGIAREIGERLSPAEIDEIVDIMGERGVDAETAVSDYVERLAIVQADRNAVETGDDAYAEEIPFEGLASDRNSPGDRGAGRQAAAGTSRVVGESRAPAAESEGAGAGRQPITPRVERTAQGDQFVLPGATRVQDSGGRLRGKAKQKAADEGLFAKPDQQDELFRLPYASPHFSPRFAEKRKVIGRQLRDELDAMGLRDVALRIPERIAVIVDGQQRGTAEGRYNRGVVDIAVTALDPTQTLRHEAIHALYRLGAFTQGEWSALTRAAAKWRQDFDIDRRYARVNASDAIMNEEAIAEAYAAWRSGRLQVGGLMQRAFNQIRRILDAIARVLRRNGFDTAASLVQSAADGTVNSLGVLERIATGDVGARLSGDADLTTDRSRSMVGTPDGFAYSLTPAEKALSDHILAKEAPGPVGRVIQEFLDVARNPYRGNTTGARYRSAITNQMVNALEPVEQAERRINQGKVADASKSAFKMAELAISDTGRVEQLFTTGSPKWNAAEGIVEFRKTGGLIDIFSPLSTRDDYTKFSLYAIARRARRLAAEGRENLLMPAQIRDGLALENPVLKKVFDRYQAFNKDMLQFAVDTGVLTQDAANEFAQHADYVPFYRVIEDDGATEALGPRMRKALSNPDTGIKKLKGGKEKIGDLLENVARNSSALLRAGMKNQAMARIHSTLRVSGELDPVGPDDSKDGAVSYYVGGKKVYFIPHDPAMVAALAAFTPDQVTRIEKVLIAMSALLRHGITANPAFMIANLFRGTTAAYVQTGANLGAAGNTVKGLLRNWRSDDVAREFKAISGAGGYGFGGMAEDVGKRLRRQIGIDKGIMARIGNALDYIEKVGEATEMADRIAVYENLRARGATKAEAAYQGLNVINYSRKGANRFLRRALPHYPFLNARIQGLYRLLETQSPGRAATTIAMQIALRGLYLTAFSMGILASYDDDDWKRYDDLPLETKLNYYVIFLGGDKRLMLPKPFEVGAIFSTLPESIVDAVRRGDGSDLARATGMTFINTFALNPIPAWALPTLENVANFDFFRMSDLESPSVQRLQPGQRATNQTSQVARIAGEAANVSPIKIQNMIEGHLGTIGAVLLNGADALLSGLGVTPSKPAGAFGSVPVGSFLAEQTLGRFYKTGPNPSSEAVSKFYELRQDADEIYQTVRDLRRRGKIDEARELAQENRALLNSRKQLEKLADTISGINAQIRKVYQDPKMSADDKRARLDDLISRRNGLAQRSLVIERRIEDAKD